MEASRARTAPCGREGSDSSMRTAPRSQVQIMKLSGLEAMPVSVVSSFEPQPACIWHYDSLCSLAISSNLTPRIIDATCIFKHILYKAIHRLYTYIQWFLWARLCAFGAEWHEDRPGFQLNRGQRNSEPHGLHFELSQEQPFSCTPQVDQVWLVAKPGSINGW